MSRFARRRWSCGVAVLASIMICLVAAPAAALFDASLGVYFDAQGTQCQGTIRPGTPATIYVLAKVGPEAGGITGAEFRFDGLPSSWTVYPVPNAIAFSLGDPFAGGVNIAFSQCWATGSVVRLYTVLVLAASEEDDVEFALVQRERPSNPNFPCPLVTACDAPMFTMHCVASYPCRVNATIPGPCDEILAVEDASWSAVRQLYR